MYEAKCLVMDYQPHAGPLVQPAAPAQPQPQHHHQFHQLHPLAPDTSARWSQYQQLWRQHMFINGEQILSGLFLVADRPKYQRKVKVESRLRGFGSGRVLANCSVTPANPHQETKSPPTPESPFSRKSCGKESPDKKDEAELWSNVEAQTAFLGPNLWEKTLPYDTDLKYVDLDEFLSENGIPVEGGIGAGTAAVPQGAAASSSGCLKELPQGRLSPATSASLVPVLTKREPSPSPSEAAAMSPLTISPPSPAESTLSFASSSRDAFDPRTRAFSDEELKPQPMVKKSRKQFVPEGLKDEKYWARRRKNNMAAKRSRDARRMKENQIALRAGFLEKENLGLRQEMDRLKKENMALRDQLSKFAPDAI